jgi:hypothetical protein
MLLVRRHRAISVREPHLLLRFTPRSRCRLAPNLPMPPTPACPLRWQLGRVIENPVANVLRFQTVLGGFLVQCQRTILEREYRRNRQLAVAGEDSNRSKNGRHASARGLHPPRAYSHQVLTAVAGDGSQVRRPHVMLHQKPLQRREGCNVRGVEGFLFLRSCHRAFPGLAR